MSCLCSFPIRNAISEIIGLPRIPDPDSSDQTLNKEWVHNFLELYMPKVHPCAAVLPAPTMCCQHIVHVVMAAMNDHPRKIEYEVAIDWFVCE